MSVPEVIVWAADGKPLPFLSYGARLAGVLRRAGARVRVVPYRRRPLTEAELAAPVHVLSGGETTSFSPDPVTMRSLADLFEVLQRARAGEATVIGVCLGSQMIARAIAPAMPISFPEAGMEAGLRPVRAADAVEGTPPLRVAELHYEQIHPSFAGVDDVEVTHTNAHSPIQGFRWGESVRGYQFHPEWDVADTAEVLRRHSGLIARRCADPGAAFASADPSVRRVPTADWSPHTVQDLVVDPVMAGLGLRAARVA